MIKAEIKYNHEGYITAFRILGHACYSDCGQDIVCAAVSAVAQTAIAGLLEVVGIETSVIAGDGYLLCKLPRDIDPCKKESVQVVLQTMVVGLDGIQREYGDYIEIVC